MDPFRRNDRQWIFARRIKSDGAISGIANCGPTSDPSRRDAALFAAGGAALDLGRLRAHLRAMPIYRYEPAGAGCPSCREGIERLQRLSDPPLDRCPDCGAALERVIGAPTVVSGGAHLLRESHVAKHGFTQYRKVGKGKYEKTAGKGPPTIGDD
jgi:putative FmdB family regulatory protein